MLPDVIQLLDHHDVGVRVPTGVGQLPEGRDDRVVVVPEVAARQDRGPVHGHGLDHDHPCATERALAVVADVAFPGQAALGHVGGVRPERDPARERPVAQLQRLEDMRERHGPCQYAAMAGAPPLIVVAGATATGKTELGIRLAEAIVASGRPATVISANSRQVYRGLDIGTAKVTAADRARVPHAGLDLVDPDRRFALSDYVLHARGVLERIARDDGVALLVGGTGLYLRAVARGLDLDALPDDPAIRARLEAEFAAEGLEPLAARLTAIAPTLASEIHLANPRRVIRALEIAELRGDGSRPRPRGYDGPVAWIGLEVARDEHARRIAARARAQFDAGLDRGGGRPPRALRPVPAGVLGDRLPGGVGGRRRDAQPRSGHRAGCAPQRGLRQAAADVVQGRTRHRVAGHHGHGPVRGEPRRGDVDPRLAAGHLGLVDHVADPVDPLDDLDDGVRVLDAVDDTTDDCGRAADADQQPVDQPRGRRIRPQRLADPRGELGFARQIRPAVVLVVRLGLGRHGGAGCDDEAVLLFLVGVDRWVDRRDVHEAFLGRDVGVIGLTLAKVVEIEVVEHGGLVGRVRRIRRRVAALELGQGRRALVLHLVGRDDRILLGGRHVALDLDHVVER